MFTRRQTFAGAAMLAIPSIARATSWFARNPFTLGIASGDPAPDGFVIWTRLAPDPYEPHGGMPMSAIPVSWQVAENPGFSVIAAKGETTARPELAHSVHVEVTGLKPDRPYWYRFSVGDQQSFTGQSRTLPAAGAAVSALRFGVCGCQHYEAGYYTAYRHLAHEDLAFVYHYGDFIYEYGNDFEYGPDHLPVPKARYHRLQSLYSLDDYRAHYAQYLSDFDLQAARTRHAFVQTFDDHEIHNNWAGDFDSDTDVPPEVFDLRREAAMQAWYEHMPVRKLMIPDGKLIHANRRFTYGNLAAINVLDTRSFRTDQPCGDQWAVAPCPGVFDPKAQMMGSVQEAWLDASLAQRDATWNCIAQQVMMMPLNRHLYDDQPATIYNLDSWAGYDTPRQRVTKRLAKAENVVVLTGDEHQNYAGLLIDGDKPTGIECVLTSISSGGDGSNLRPGSDKILAENPQLKFINDQRGYGVCEVTPDAWKTHFMVVDKISVPGGALSRRATATVPRGEISLAID
jgi:alkaline phosphatase D